MMEKKFDSQVVPGLSLKSRAISPLVEETLVGWFSTFGRTEVPGGRLVTQFGVPYNYATKTSEVEKTTELPDPLKTLLRTLDLPPAEEDKWNVIVNWYEPGQGIKEHTDSPCFGDAVWSLSLGAPVTMVLRKAGSAAWLWLPQRSLLELTGEARWHWTHEIQESSHECVLGRRVPRGPRISVTFRQIAASLGNRMSS